MYKAKKVKPHSSQAHTAGAYPGFLSMKPTRSIATPPGWEASPSQVTIQHFVAGTHSYSWVERGTVRVKCLEQEHKVLTPASTRTRTTRSGVKRANH